MDYITLLEMAVHRKPFRLHPGLTPEHYQITDSLRDCERWRAITHCGTSYSEQWLKSQGERNREPGELMEIGYVMISLVDDTIVPIARGDEHHQGMDVMYDDISEECNRNGHPINPSDYVSIWTGGSNYIHSKKDIKPLLIALKKYLSYGGIDGPLKGSYDMNGLLMNSSEFVARKGRIDINQDELAPAGQRIYDSFVVLADSLRAGLGSEQRSLKGKAFQTAIKFAKQMRMFLTYLAIDDYDVLVKPEILDSLRKDGSDEALKKVEQLFFGFSGIKNQMHNAIKECYEREKVGEKNHWTDDNIKAMWGNLELAIDKLARI